MKPNQILIAISATAITGSILVGTTSQAQACWRTSQPTSTNSAGQFPQSFNSTSASSQSPQPFNSSGSAVGVALLGGLLAVGGVYLSRRWRQLESVADAEQPELPLASLDEQIPERELVGGRK
jgi:hypothetical protein